MTCRQKTTETNPDNRLRWFRARWYDTGLGGWISPEPARLDGPNLYWALTASPSHNYDSNGRYSVASSSTVNKAVRRLRTLKEIKSLSHFDAHAFCFVYANSKSKDLRPGPMNDAGLRRGERIEDALLYCNWQCCVAQFTGFAGAQNMGNANEHGTGDSPDTRADLHNNQAGRRAALWCHDDRPCALKCASLRKRGALSLES